MINTDNETKFTAKDITDYYDYTIPQYEQWWKLKEAFSLHYGVWDQDTRSFAESLRNTNRVLLEKAKIKKTDYVLDAGCGVGGAAFYIARTSGAKVVGITLSKRQVAYATRAAEQQNLSELVSFQLCDYTKTHFKEGTFDVVWACESISYAPDKEAFIREAYRILKKGGRLIICDVFLASDNQKDEKQWMKKLGSTWAIHDYVSPQHIINIASKNDFTFNDLEDKTAQIYPSVRRLYTSFWVGAIPSIIYNFLYKGVNKFGKTHYLCGYYQYKALKAKLWKYCVILATKQ